MKRQKVNVFFQSWNSLVKHAMERGILVTGILSCVLSATLLYFGYSYLVEPGVLKNRQHLGTMKPEAGGTNSSAAATTPASDGKPKTEAAKNVSVSSGQSPQTILQKEAENAKTAALLENQQKFYAEYAKLITLYREAEPLLPQETEVSGVLEQVGEAARRNNVTLRGLNAAREGVKSPTAELLYEREVPALVSGEYPNIVRFFYDLSRMPRIILVRDFAVSANKTNTVAAATLVAFHAPPPAELPQIPAEVKKLISAGGSAAVLEDATHRPPQTGKADLYARKEFLTNEK
jgi:hypothetical protein